MESFQEASDLGLYFVSHAHFCHPADPLLLVILVYECCPTSRDELLDFVHTELMADVGEVELIRDGIESIVLHRSMQLVVLLLQVVEFQLLAQDKFVEGSGEEGIHVLAFGEGFSNDTTHKFEVFEMLWIDVGLAAGLISVPGGAGLK